MMQFGIALNFHILRMHWDKLILFADMDNEDLVRISRAMYMKIYDIIGDPVIIDIRRTTSNLRDNLLRMEHEFWNRNYVPCYSGSKAEGLRFESSDDDWMFIHRVIKVIPSYSLMTMYDSNTTLLLMENEMTKPGFTLLRLIGGSTKREIRMSTEYILNGCYMSCKHWREYHTNFFSDFDITHGPCASGTFGPLEFDYAFCLQCDVWPTNAHDCIKRFHQSSWPSDDTLLSIVKDGVLFVPIGAKSSIFENTEWRMSFSLAEKKLIHSMNHTQFLCYGLLKIFLKEAIDANPDVKGLLCSYFLKTALFWEITMALNQWNPSSFLSCFWNCFRRLLKWVNCSYCPNFFIPQNNMFEGKIEGKNRDSLLEHLRNLFHEGYMCLLRCQSLSDYLFRITRRPTLVLWSKPTKSWIAMNIISECFKQLAAMTREHPLTDLSATRYILLQRLATTTNNIHHRFILKNWLSEVVTEICMTESKHIAAKGICNRTHYKNITERLHVLKRFTGDSVSHILYQAIMCYKIGKYYQAVRLVLLSKEKMSAPHSLHICCFDEEQYRQAGGETLPIETVMKRHSIKNVCIENDMYISDLYIESHGFDPNFYIIGFFIPATICALFVQYLCQKRFGCQFEADEALYELSLLVQNADETLIADELRGISWQILGICQQMNGDDWGACHSYLMAILQDTNIHRVAACVRLGTIIIKYI